ncbi:RNA polymerase I-specific transcription initiation factor RRN3-like [Daktulosphaira vitifoliae]|uniref:RNA polymerase I-specific transcription initiation factor RRN3-like n=1 Tax=Daktulosphaira vitifoliae TaxID=58002 RepID=UPI0021A9EB8B|nr:RNA polymerase I-specific transcription initiation factor RRN3-like [Daktulosphaira vitifoliae]
MSSCYSNNIVVQDNHLKCISSPSILKKQNILSINNVPKRKVHFDLFNNLKSMLIHFDQTDDRDKIQYNNLICDIRDTGNDFKDSELVKLLKDARHCVNILNENLTLFVKVVLILKWKDRGEEVVNEYSTFVLDVCSAHNYHTKFAIEQLVTCFSQIDNTVVDRINGIPNEREEIGYQNVHKIIKDLLKAIPLAKEILITTLQKKFPYKKSSPEVHLHYVHNLLLITQYEPSLRRNILNLMINKLVEIDVHIPKEELERLGSCSSNEIEENIFAMDVDGDCISASPEIQESESFVCTLDMCLKRIFDYIKTFCYDKEGVLLWDNTKLLYQDLLSVFESEILPTYASSHVQYIIYYFLSFKFILAEKFSCWLWKKCCDVSAPSTIRQAAAGYLASFMSRAPFISINVLKNTVGDMSVWCNNYINRVDKSVKVVNEELLRWHAVFYSLCQSLFYIISFRHEDLMDSKRNLKFMENLNLSNIVTSRLSPLRVCCSKISMLFAQVTKIYQLTYCYPVMDDHVRITDESIKDQWLYAFFPFEPYVLPRLKHLFGSNLYRSININKNPYIYQESYERKVSYQECMDISPSMLISSCSPGNTDWFGKLTNQYHFNC